MEYLFAILSSVGGSSRLQKSAGNHFNVDNDKNVKLQKGSV
jgi:hypothetical protein